MSGLLVCSLLSVQLTAQSPAAASVGSSAAAHASAERTTDLMDAPALSTSEKFTVMRKSAIGVVPLLGTAVEAGLSQAFNTQRDYGQGAEGYGKRYGAGFADQASRNFFSEFLYPVVFKEDPRYFRLGHGSFSQRSWYALKQEFICHTDSGTPI